MRYILAIVISILLFSILVVDNGNAESKDLLVLSGKNTISLNMPIEGQTTKNIQLQLLDKSNKLGKNEPIYLFLNSPGGSIDDGLRIIEVAKSLPQPVHTVSLFSASMSFIISQYLGKRYVLSNSTMMSHRAYGGGIEGQIPGSLLSRTLFTLAQIVSIEDFVAKRSKMSLKSYEDLIANELWMGPEQAVSLKFADKVVRVRCDKSLQGLADPSTLDVMGFKVQVTFNKCPLITEPMQVDIANEATTKAREVADLIIHDRERFVREYVQTNRLSEVLY